MDERRLRRAARAWTASTVAHTIPFLAGAAALIALQPLSAPVAFVLVAHAWLIPELYAKRGANVLKAPPAPPGVGLLRDLVGHEARQLHSRTGLVLERGRFGVWVVGEAGALLVRPGGRRVHCFCVHATDDSLPAGDRTAHLLLALRADEAGFATVANQAFSGARWRVRRRLAPRARPAVDAAARAAG
jgi:hypothetical protein